MATEVPPQAQPSRANRLSGKPYRLTGSQFLKMIDAGILRQGTRVELLGGLLIQQMTKCPRHSFVIGSLVELIRPMLADSWLVQQESPLELGARWRPEPDISVIKGPWSLYRERSPRANAVALLVEVAESSYSIDRGPKWRLYAATRIAAYWIVNLAQRDVEVYTDPVGNGRSASYQTPSIHAAEAEIPVIIDGKEVGRVAVRDVLP